MEALRSEQADGMQIDWDAPILMQDGEVLRADVFRPIAPGQYPVIISYGPYAKWLPFTHIRGEQWKDLCEQHPEVPAGSSNKYQNWEVVDPEKWVPDGYVCVRVDSRGAGRSPGVMDCWSLKEAQDFAECIEWAGTQPWSNGKVGLNGISYFAMNQWQVAPLQPRHLAAICVWEGSADLYRDMGYHGGVPSGFLNTWRNTVLPYQNGLGTNGIHSTMTNDWVSGPETLAPEQLKANVVDIAQDTFDNSFATDAYWQKRAPDWSKVTVPLLSAGNWGGQGLHLRGNVEGYLNAHSKEKWLEMHGLEHWTHFYTNYGLDLQKKFFGHFLKGEDTGWSQQPPISLNIRHPGERFVPRAEKEWPLARTQWTKYYLDLEYQSLSTTAPGKPGTVSYGGMSDGVTFMTEPLQQATEITGPIAAKLWVSSATANADLFLVVRLFAPDMTEVTFSGALDPHTPIAQGWLRASRRKLDTARSKPYRPYHTHDEDQPLTPGEIYELDIEILPTCIVAPKGFRIALAVRGKDYECQGTVTYGAAVNRRGFSGVGPFVHKDPRKRPEAVFGGEVTLHADAQRQPYVMLPIIPS